MRHASAAFDSHDSGLQPSRGVVAIVGRPNVGKSTLFNRTIGRRKAITAREAGTTRDRVYGDVEWAGARFALIDTGGLDFSDQQHLTTNIRLQAKAGASEADVVILVVDGAEGITGADLEAVDWIRQLGKPVVVAVNKVDNDKRSHNRGEFYSLGFDRVLSISALHGRGIDDLLEATFQLLPETSAQVDADDDDEITIAIVGRPNVGKSQLLNTLTRRDRAIVSDLPGTTRDPVDSLIEFGERRIRLVDTAGIRRRGRINPGAERFSVGRALQAISRSDMAVLVIDATERVSAQDMHLAGYVDEQGKGLIVAVNKWDLIEDKAGARLYIEDWLRSSLAFARYFLIEFTSAKTGYHVDRLFKTAALIHDSRRLQVPTPALNQVIQKASQMRRPASTKGRTLNVFYATQVDVAPPTFTIFVNDPQLAHFSYVRYLMNQIRRAWDFPGTPIKINLRARPRTGNRADEH